MFELIHEFAVLGTASFMMALATVWYSPMLFGKVWMKETGLTNESIEAAEVHMLKHMLLTFTSYTVMLTLLALVLAYLPMLPITALQAAVLISVFVAASAVGPTLFEGRSLTYYAIRVGFYVLFIVLGTFILEFWPW